MRAMAESFKLMTTDRELAYRVISKKIGLTDRKVFDAAYTQELKVLEPKLEIRPESDPGDASGDFENRSAGAKSFGAAAHRPAVSRRDGKGRDV